MVWQQFVVILAAMLIIVAGQLLEARFQVFSNLIKNIRHKSLAKINKTVHKWEPPTGEFVLFDHDEDFARRYPDSAKFLKEQTDKYEAQLSDLDRMRRDSKRRLDAQKNQIFHLNGVMWTEAPLPPVHHDCYVQSYAIFDWFTQIERCACGAQCFRCFRGDHVWLHRNSRRKEKDQ